MKVYTIYKSDMYDYEVHETVGVYSSRKKAENKIRELFPVEKLNDVCNMEKVRLKTNNNGTPILSKYGEYIVTGKDEDGEEYEDTIESDINGIIYTIIEDEVQ